MGKRNFSECVSGLHRAVFSGTINVNEKGACFCFDFHFSVRGRSSADFEILGNAARSTGSGDVQGTGRSAVCEGTVRSAAGKSDKLSYFSAVMV